MDIPTPRPKQQLTAQTVKHAKATGTAYRLADGDGLYLLVSPNGTRSWVLRTLVKGHRSDIGLGSIAVRSLAQARDEAARLRRIARSGGDPLAARKREQQDVPTFRAAATTVHAAEAATFRNEKHRKQWLSSLTPVLDEIGTRRVSDLTSADLIRAMAPMWRATPETARRVLQRVNHVFEWCRVHGFCSGDNPASGLTKALPKHRPSKQHHAALAYPEVGAFVHELRASERCSEVVRLAFEFTILTAARTSETLYAQWSEFDFDGATWTVPAGRMKAGVEHRVPLSARCLAILKRARTVAGDSAYAFPGRTGKAPLSNMAFLMALRRMKHGDITAHGFRSSFRDWAAEQTNVPRAVCEAALAHTLRDKTEAAYHRSDLFERRRELMTQWATFATADPAKVVSLSSRKRRRA
jgi:integrase